MVLIKKGKELDLDLDSFTFFSPFIVERILNIDLPS